VAFDKRTGKEIYQAGDDLASYASIRTMDVGGRRLALAFARSGLLGVDVAEGSVLFQYPWRARKLESVNAASPLIGSDRVFITESYELGGCQLRLVAAREPEVIWRDQPRGRQRILASHWMTPVLQDGYMYGCSGESNGNAELRCVNWQTGEVAWSQKKLARCSLLSVDDHLLVVNEYGHLWLIKANPSAFEVVAESENLVEDGKPLLNRPVWPAPVLSHGLLYLRGAGRLVCAELIPSS
jgi:outer membrane protein assembly factor BamB